MRSTAPWFNTLLGAAAAAGLTVAAVGVLLVMSQALRPGDSAPFSWFSTQLAQAQGLGGGEEILAFALSVVAGLAGILIMLIELRLLLPAGAAALLISDDELGRTTIERDSVESFLALVASAIESVEHAQVSVRGGNDGDLRVRVRLGLSPSRATVVPTTSEAVREAMVAASESHLGLEIVDLVVTTAMRPGRAERKRKRLQLA